MIFTEDAPGLESAIHRRIESSHLNRANLRREFFTIGSRDILDDLNKILGFWKLSRDELNAKTRAIWASGWKPGRDPMNDDSVGSGADVEGKDEQ